jgi:hypothetical protein
MATAASTPVTASSVAGSLAVTTNQSGCVQDGEEVPCRSIEQHFGRLTATRQNRPGIMPSSHILKGATFQTPIVEVG